MIIIFLGNLGSGKTLNAVRTIVNDKSDRKTYTNIGLKKYKHFYKIKPQDVILKEKDEKGKEKLDLNVKFWQKQKKPLNIIWDEVHLTANARSSMTKANMVISRFIAMARRIVGFDKRGYGHLIFIAQSERTIDANIRDLVNEIDYHIGHWVLRCSDCGHNQSWNSQMHVMEKCLNCDSPVIEKTDFTTEVLKFKSWDSYYKFILMGSKLYFERILIEDIEDYFKYYDTLQFENIWENYIS